MSWYLCFVVQNASITMQNWFVLCSIESKTSFIALCLVHLLCKWCWNCTKRHSLHIFENLVETERHLMHTSCIRLFTCLNVLLADRDIFKCLGSQTGMKSILLEKFNFLIQTWKIWIWHLQNPETDLLFLFFKRNQRTKHLRKMSNVNVPAFCRVSLLT